MCVLRRRRAYHAPMTRWAPAKHDVLSALADEILHNYSRGRVRVAVDSPDPVLSQSFADDLVAVIRESGHAAFAAHLSAFSRPRADWADRRDVDGDEAGYTERYDYSALRRVLLDPFRMGGSTGFVLAAYSAERDAAVPAKWVTGPADIVLVVGGEFANRPELRAGWNLSIWLDTGAAPNPYYLADADPRARASVLMDLTDVEHPRRVFADSC